MNEAPPAVHVFKNLAEASAVVLADFAGGERLDLPSLADENAGAFGLSVLWRSYAGSRRTASPGHKHLGHYRFQRLAPRDTPTLPDEPIDSACPQHMLTYRIEDHFVELDQGRELLMLAEVFRGPFSLGLPRFIPPLDAIAFDERGVIVPRPQATCDHAFLWSWNDDAEHTP
jgi:hypothetical protein